MKVTIEHGGKKVDVELTAEQVKELGLQEEKKTGWARAEYNEHYYYINDDTTTAFVKDTELDVLTDTRRYDFGNYFTDRTLAEKMCKRVSLMLRMQRWADEHNGPLDWQDKRQCKHYIYRNCENKLVVDYVWSLDIIGTVFFSSGELAEQAIEEFGDEIIDCYAESEVTRP